MMKSSSTATAIPNIMPIAESEPVADTVAELAAMVERALGDCVWITAVAVDELIIERISGSSNKSLTQFIP